MYIYIYVFIYTHTGCPAGHSRPLWGSGCGGGRPARDNYVIISITMYNFLLLITINISIIITIAYY